MDQRPMVLIILGSASDLPIMEDGVTFLRETGVSFSLEISSAHRHPERTSSLAREARSQGVEVIIAGAGLAAHLPGVVAAHTSLPVIGIPLQGGALAGVDALLSIVQMPKGVPVATVGINASRNAAILACQILGIKHPEVAAKLDALKERMKAEVEESAKNAKI
jgi:5-(carboxyamino)imidazole ribonucleotide mutase